MSLDVMKQALEYLDSPSSKLWPAGTQHNIITALRLAIEQAERVKRAEEAFAAASDGMKGEQAERQEPVAWRDHVEQRLLTWRQRFVNRSGDQLALDDFMDKESLNDLIDFVCDEYTAPPRQEKQEPVCDKDPQGCWNVRCQLGKVCKNAAPPQRQPLTDAEITHLWETLYDHGNGKYEGGKSQTQRARAFEILKRIGGDHE
jgi:hypothetical protein